MGVGVKSLLFCGLLYLIPSLLMYLAYSPGNLSDLVINELYYKTFLKVCLLFRLINFLMIFSFLHGVSMFTIYNIEMLEKIKAVQSILRDSEGNLLAFNVLTARIIFVALTLFLSKFVTDLRLVYAINGIFINSVIGMIIPGFLGIYRGEQRRFDSMGVRISDYLCVVSGILCIVLYVTSLG